MNYADLDLKYDRVTIVPINNSNIFIASMNDEYLEDLKRHFSNKVAHARFTPQYKSGNWDGFIRFLGNNGVLPRGLLGECIGILKQWKIKYDLDPELEHEPIDISNLEEVIKETLMCNQEVHMEPWQHQWDATKELLKAKRGIVKAATSAGKSYIITMAVQYLLTQKLAKKILLVVPRSDLVIQFQRDAIEYGFNGDDVGMFFGKIKDVEQPWIVATWQSLQNVTDREFFESFDVLMIDEVHGAKSSDNKSKSKRQSGGTKMRQICDNCVNAEWRFGCTGTLPTEELDVRTIISGIGPLVYEVKASELMRQGHVTQLEIIIPFLSYDKKLVKEKITEYLLEEGITDKTRKEDIPATAKFNAEKKFLENYIPRLKLIAKITKSRLKKDENVLILANTLNFGNKILKTIKFLCKDDLTDAFYISGEMDEYTRKDIREKMEAGKRIVVVATTSLFSTGISVKNLHAVILGNMGKSKTVVLQSIGRSLRQHSTKEKARVYDLCDNLKYNGKHAQERMNFYADEDFDIKIQELVI